MLSNKALLVNMSISQWGARKYDRKATDTVESSYSTKGKVGQYTKKLLPGAKELDAINGQASAMRTFFYTNTLPWCTDGSRIIKATHYMAFVEEYRTHKAAFDRAIEQFMAAYPSLRDDAKTTLGSLFNEIDYPSIGRLKASFQCDVSFMPMPDVQDFRVQVLDEEKQAFVERMKDVETTAMRDCWKRLYDVVSRAASKLSEPDAIFRDSLIENVNDLCSLLPKLNVMDDATLETMRQNVERTVGALNVNVIRQVPVERDKATKELEALMSSMSVFMGV